MLRLVHPAPEGQAPRPPGARRRRPPILTAAEERHLRTTLKNLARAYGGYACLASVLGMTHKALLGAAYKSQRHLSANLALLAARAAGSTVEAVIGGKLTAAGRCPTCGSCLRERVAAGGAS